MNRLTGRNENGDLLLCGKEVYGNNSDIYNSISLLEEYEDTGLAPEEIIRIIKGGVPEWIDKYLEYRKLEAEGLLIKLPCKVDDTVYTTFCDKVYEKTIDKIIINRFTTPQIWVETKLPFATSSLERWDIAIGKTIFATREEAENKLKEMEKDINGSV